MSVRIRIVRWRAMRRFFNLVLGAMAMVAVAMVSAFVTMRLAIHGREVKVPDLSHMTISEASRKASSMGLRLQLENKFYSPNTPPGQVLAQFPAAGMTVRRQWPVRVTESLGSQQVSIPDLTGQGERSVAINLRRLGLELGTVGHIAAPGAPGVVVAQTPPPNAQGVERPRVSVLMSQPDSADADAFVMPSLIGLSLAGAYARTGAAGLRILSAEDVTPAAPAASASSAGSAAPVSSAAVPASPPAVAALAPGVVAAQSPPAGHKVYRGDVVRLSLTH